LVVHAGHSEAEVFWTEFLRSLADRGLRGVKLVIADDHKGLRAAARRVFNATHQRCRVHWLRNALAYAPAKQRTAVAAMQKTIFAQETRGDAEAQWGVVADALREKQPKLGDLMDASRDDGLAYMDFPREHWPQIVSTDEMDKRFHGSRGSLSVRRRPRGEARRIGCERRRAARECLAGLRRLRTTQFWSEAAREASGVAQRAADGAGSCDIKAGRIGGSAEWWRRYAGLDAWPEPSAGAFGGRRFQRATNCS
jgi:hypothetical protein